MKKLALALMIAFGFATFASLAADKAPAKPAKAPAVKSAAKPAPKAAK